MYRLMVSRANSTHNIIKKSFYKLQAYFYKNSESCYKNYKHAVFLSKADADCLSYKSNVITTSMGVKCIEKLDELPVDDKIVFFGNLSYLPNVDSVIWFANYVWPKVFQSNSKLTFLIAGAKPLQCVKNLANKFQNIEVIDSPFDLSLIIQQSRLVVAPVIWGAGQKTKLLDAMGKGRPIICSPHAIEGTEFVPDVHLKMCFSIDDWIESILRLISNDDALSSLRLNAYNLVKSSYSWKRSASDLTRLYEQY
jgi:glycosyltransferase involved in cell wall biosynthesis